MKTVINYGTKAANAAIIDLPTAKLNSNIDFNDQDTLFQLFLDAIETEIENFIGAPVIERAGAEIQVDTWTESLTFSIPVNDVVSVAWLNDAGVETPITDFDFFGDEITIDMDEPTGFHRLKIVVNAGFAEIPKDIKNAALLMFSERETYRENRPVKLNNAAQNILRAYKIY